MTKPVLLTGGGKSTFSLPPVIGQIVRIIGVCLFTLAITASMGWIVIDYQSHVARLEYAVKWSSVLGGLAILVSAAWYLWRSYHFKKEAREKQAVELLGEWARGRTYIPDVCFRLANGLDLKSALAVWNRSSCSVTANEIEVLQILFPEKKFKVTENLIALDIEDVFYIEHHWTAFFNALEFLASAWDRGTADQDIMEEQLRPFIVGNLSAFLTLLDDKGIRDCFPATARRVLKLVQEHKIPNGEKYYRTTLDGWVEYTKSDD